MNKYQNISRISTTILTKKSTKIGLGITLIICGTIFSSVICGPLIILIGIIVLFLKQECIEGNCPYCQSLINFLIPKGYKESSTEKIKCKKCKNAILVYEYKFFTFNAYQNRNSNEEIEVIPFNGLPENEQNKLDRNKKAAYTTFFIIVGLLSASCFVSSQLSGNYTLTSYKSPNQSIIVPTNTPQILNTQQPVPQQPLEHKIGDSVQVGYMNYQVHKIEWKQALGNQYFGKKANSRFLLVDISVMNTDKEQRMVPEFKLEDGNGVQYETDDAIMYLGDKAFFLQMLNPNVQKRGLIAFDIPPNNNYTLILSGGYWSSEETKIKLN